MSEEKAHAEFGPSSLKYVAKCAGYKGNSGTNPAAEKGNRIHAALEHRKVSMLTDADEIAIYNSCVKEEDQLFAMIFGDNECDTLIREKRISLDIKAKTETFGTADVVATRGDTALIVDYKTGYSKIDEVRDNWQAKAYVLGVFQEHEHLNHCTFAFIVPKRDEVLWGQFMRLEVPALRAEISAIISRAEVTRPKWEQGTIDIDDVNPSVDCRFCAFESKCPALGALTLGVAARLHPELSMLPAGNLQITDDTDTDTIEKLYAVAKIVETWCSSVRYQAVQRAMAGTELPNYKLRSLGQIKKITSQDFLLKLAAKYNVTPEDIIESSTISLADVTAALHKKTPKKAKAKTVEAFVAEAEALDIVELGAPRYTLTSR